MTFEPDQYFTKLSVITFIQRKNAQVKPKYATSARETTPVRNEL
jgi:hypothetical protein